MQRYYTNALNKSVVNANSINASITGKQGPQRQQLPVVGVALEQATGARGSRRSASSSPHQQPTHGEPAPEDGSTPCTCPVAPTCTPLCGSRGGKWTRCTTINDIPRFVLVVFLVVRTLPLKLLMLPLKLLMLPLKLLMLLLVWMLPLKLLMVWMLPPRMLPLKLLMLPLMLLMLLLVWMLPLKPLKPLMPLMLLKLLPRRIRQRLRLDGRTTQARTGHTNPV
jgi:hypothetical protein